MSLPKGTASEPGSDELIAARVRERLFGGAPPAVRIGRFTVIEEIGRGGMGAVHAAYDDQLDRKVAIKVLTCDEDEDESQQRFLREGQAMARLSHPNVVTVHEVGESDGQFFLAMEFIRGQSLSKWMKGEPEWREVLEVFIQAGQGLAAAHDAGLVHRDLKPANIMRSEDGVVKVLDFGLARVMEDASTESLDVPSVSSSVLSSSFTRTGTVMGTPAYMPPEQMQGEAVDARSDQFSFCVALYHALFGVRPFAGKSIADLMSAMLNGELEPGTKGARVPTPVRKAVLRGLSVDPNERWHSMHDLLEPLRRHVAPRRRGVIALGVTVGLLGIGAERYAAWSERCTGAEAQLVEVWDDARREQVRTAIHDTELPYAQDTWSRVEPQLDDYAVGWARAHTEACEATAVRHEQSDKHLDLRMGCLWELRQRLRATVDELARADATVVEHAVEAVVDMPPLSRCDDVDALSAAVPPPDDPAVAERVARLDEQLVAIEARALAGKYEDALERADAIVTEAVSLEYEPLMARAWQRQGVLREQNGDYEGALASLTKAYDAAIAQEIPPLAASSSAKIMGLLADPLARHDAAEQWAAQADPLSRAAQTEEARAEYLLSRAVAFDEAGKHDEAQGYAERALAIREKLRGTEDLDIARAVHRLGVITRRQGNYDEARRLQERVVAIVERALGAEHPRVAVALSSLGNIAQEEGSLDEAQALLLRALEIQKRALGPDHPESVRTLSTLGVILEMKGEYDQARLYYHRVLTFNERTMGPEHPSVAGALTNLGIVMVAQGDYAEAYRTHQRALEIFEKALGPDHPQVGATLSNLGIAADDLGKLDEAHAAFSRALEIFEKALGPEHPYAVKTLANLATTVADRGDQQKALELTQRVVEAYEGSSDELALAASLNNRGSQQLALGRDDEARESFERALALKERNLGSEHVEVASTLHNLALVIGKGGDDEEARGILERAIAIREAIAGPDNQGVTIPLLTYGRTLIAIGEHADGLAALERVLTIRTETGIGIANARFALARALWSLPAGHGRDRSRARELAERVREEGLGTGDYAVDAAELETWLAEHRLR